MTVRDDLTRTLNDLRRQLQEATEPAAYDELKAEIAEIERAISIASAQERRAEKQRQEQDRAESERRYTVALARVGELRKQGEELALEMFNALRLFYEAGEMWTDLQTDLAQAIEAVNRHAKKIGAEMLQPHKPEALGLRVDASLSGITSITSELFRRFDSHYLTLSSQRRKGSIGDFEITAEMMKLGRLEIAPDGRIINKDVQVRAQ